MEIAGTSSKKQEVENSDHQFLVDIGDLEECMERELETLRLHRLSYQCCIHEVPGQLFELNEKAYTPRAVSIGPLHHGKKELKAMEEHKRRYLIDFLQRNKLTLQDLIKATEEYETRLRESYDEIIDIPRKEFIKLMIVDTAFLIEYFLKFYFGYKSNDRVLGNRKMASNIRFDILMLENQVPFFFIDHLFNLSKNNTASTFDDVILLVLMFLAIQLPSIKDNMILKNTNFQEQHLVDLLRYYMLPSEPNQKKQYSSLSTPTVTHLHQAGVKFKSDSSKCLFDIEFKNGILEIPKWKITDCTEILFRNIQAFEHCSGDNSYFGDYITIMDRLIDSQEDVEVLVQNEIIENWLQDSQAVATFVNNLGKHNM